MIRETDWKLIDLLTMNAREPTASLARKLGLSRSTIQSRLSRLEETGTIAGYTVRLGEAVERSQVKAYVMITVAPKLAGRVSIALRKMIPVRSLQTISGAHDLIAMIATESTAQMDSVIDEIGAIPGIERTTTSIILSTKFER